VFTIRAACEVKGIQFNQATAAIQGFGNAGSISAQLLSRQGAKVVAVSDSRGGLFNSKGLDMAAVAEHKEKTGSVIGYREAEAISSAAVLEVNCDILVPAALENQITVANAARIRAKIVAEAANGPTTPAADAILYDKGILVIPDILANAGGVTVSYFEWVQDLQELFWDEDEVNGKLEKIMLRSFKDVHSTAQKYGVDMRTGAYILAINRVAQATQWRGIWP
jgi:glutamate dehydrogenase (NAD(P)+)